MSWIAAVLIVAIHVANWDGPSGVVTRIVREGVVGLFIQVAVPFFFLAGGYFLARHAGEPGWWRQALRSRVRTLLVPFAIFNLAALIIEGAERLLRTPASLDWKWAVATLGLDFCDFPGHDVLWYVRSFLLLVVLSPVLYACLKRLPTSTLSVLGLLALVHVPYVFGSNPSAFARLLKYSLVPNGVFAFAVGMAVRRYGIPPRWRAWYATCRAGAVLWGAVLCLVALRVALFCCTPQTRGGVAALLWTKALLAQLAIPVVLAALFRIMPRKEWPWSWTSFAVFVLHTYVLAVIRMAGLPPASLNIGWFFLYVLTVTVSATLGAFWLREFTPACADVLFGGRLNREKDGPRLGRL